MNWVAEARKLLCRRKTVLTPLELKRLRRVRTSAEEAEMILERNVPLLKALRGNKTYRGVVGCPHCGSAESRETAKRMCTKCAWTVRGFHSCGGYGAQFCCSATFGGVKLGTQYLVSYRYNCEDIIDVATWRSMSLKRSMRFIQGHLEWALDVIDRATDRYVKEAVCHFRGGKR